MGGRSIRLSCVVAVVLGLGTGGASAQRYGDTNGIRPPIGGGVPAAPYRGGGYGRGHGLGVGVGIGAILLNAPRRPDPQPVYEPVGTSRGGPRHRPKRRPRRLLATAAKPRPAFEPPSPPPRRPSPRPGLAVPAASEHRYLPDEILVTLKGNVALDAVTRFEVTYGLTPIASARIDLIDATVRRYRLRPGASVRETLVGLGQAPAFIAAAQPNFLFALQAEANPLPQKREAPDRPVQYAVTSLKLDAAHQIATGTDVTIAVIDTGLDETNAELAGRIAGRFDALDGRFLAHAHGTAMAGVIVAHNDLVGIAPDAKLLAIRAFASLNDGGADGTSYDILRGLDFAAAHGARIVNMSFAGPRDDLLEAALGAARQRGIIEIAAMGNAGPRAKPLFPAAYLGVIAVTATDAQDKLFPMANRGPYVAFAAPGVNILAPGLGGSVQLTSGTSIATAEASGIAALLLQTDMKASVEDVRKRLSQSAKRLALGPGTAGAGLLDAYGAVSAAAR